MRRHNLQLVLHYICLIELSLSPCDKFAHALNSHVKYTVVDANSAARDTGDPPRLYVTLAAEYV